MRYLSLIFIIAASTLAQDRPQLTWQGGVSGSAVLYIQGDRVDVQGRDTGAVDRPTYNFSSPLPTVRGRVDVEVVRGRGRVEVIEQPVAANQFTAVVRIDSPNARRYESYSLEFFWDDDRPGQNRGLRRNRGLNARGDASGEMSWSGQVDHEAIVELRARRVNVRTLRGRPVYADGGSVSSALPRREVNVQLDGVNGRGRVELVSQPNAGNNYTAAVRILDEEGGAGQYSFRLLWEGDSYGSTGSSRPYPAYGNSSGGGILTPGGGNYDSAAGAGSMLWRGRVDGTVRVSVRDNRASTTRVSGGPVQGEQVSFGGALPRNNSDDIEVRKVRGRGDVDVIQRPSGNNGWTLIFEIEDKDGGADEYEVEVRWR